MSSATSEHIEIKVDDGTTMVAWVAQPSSEIPQRGLLVFPEIFGVNPHIRDVTNRFAAEGFATIAPELFHRTAPPMWESTYDDLAPGFAHMQQLTEAGLESDARAAYNWLKHNSDIGANIASVGYCLGGRTSFLANTALPLKAAVSYYGGNIPAHLSRTNTLSGPMLFFWGELDHHIPAEQRNQVISAMQEAKKEYVNIVFSNADHGFFCDARKSYNPDAARVAWSTTLSFLNARLQ